MSWTAPRLIVAALVVLCASPVFAGPHGRKLFQNATAGAPAPAPAAPINFTISSFPPEGGTVTPLRVQVSSAEEFVRYSAFEGLQTQAVELLLAPGVYHLAAVAPNRTITVPSNKSLILSGGSAAILDVQNTTWVIGDNIYFEQNGVTFSNYTTWSLNGTTPQIGLRVGARFGAGTYQGQYDVTILENNCAKVGFWIDLLRPLKFPGYRDNSDIGFAFASMFPPLNYSATYNLTVSCRPTVSNDGDLLNYLQLLQSPNALSNTSDPLLKLLPFINTTAEAATHIEVDDSVYAAAAASKSQLALIISQDLTWSQQYWSMVQGSPLAIHRDMWWGSPQTTPTAVDVRLLTGVISIDPGVTLTLSNLQFWNLPAGPIGPQTTGWQFAAYIVSPLWTFGINRNLTQPQLILEDCNLIITQYELDAMRVMFRSWVDYLAGNNATGSDLAAPYLQQLNVTFANGNYTIQHFRDRVINFSGLSIKNWLGVEFRNVTISIPSANGRQLTYMNRNWDDFYAVVPTNPWIVFDAANAAAYATTPPAAAAAKSSSSSGKNVGAIVGGVVGGVIALLGLTALAIAAVYAWRRRSTKAGLLAVPAKDLSLPVAGDKGAENGQRSASDTIVNDQDFFQLPIVEVRSVEDGRAPEKSKFEQLELDKTASLLRKQFKDAQLELHHVLSRSPHGTTYVGTYNGRNVVIKTVVVDAQMITADAEKLGQSLASRDDLINGDQDLTGNNAFVALAEHYWKLSHDNLVLNYAHDIQALYSGTGEERWVADYKVYMVQEFCNGGQLHAAVRRKAFHSDDGKPQLPVIMHALQGIVAGLEYLHGNGVHHGNLNSTNIFLTLPQEGVDGENGNEKLELQKIRGGNFGTKIANYNMALRMDRASFFSKIWVGTPFYMAPEVRWQGNVSDAADIYSLGVIMWELWHGMPPYEAARSGAITNRSSFGTFDASCPAAYSETARACMSEDTQLRPSLADIQKKLHNLKGSAL